MRLVERERELAELAELLAGCAAGRAGAATVGGGIGCGKTELLAAARAQAAEAGFLVLSATGSWAERGSQCGVLNQLLRSAGLEPLDLPGPDELNRCVDDLAEAAERSPVLVCVDDVEFTDSLSLHWLVRLLPRLRDTRIALLLAECTLAHPSHPQLHAELLRRPGYRRITLERLTPAGVTALLAEQLGEAAAAALGERCHTVSGGNPLLVRALLEDQRPAAAPSAPGGPELAVGEAYGDTVLSCLHRGRPVLPRIAQALAVLDEDEDGGDLLARLVEETPDTVARAEHALRVAGLLDGRRLGHPVARRAVLAGLTTAERAGLHRRAAGLLYQEGAEVTRIARHLLGAAPEPGLQDPGGPQPPAWAVAVLREAAERHLAGNRAKEARTCLDEALRICRDDGVRVTLRALLASAAWVLNPSISATHLGELAVALREGRLPDHHALMLAKYLLWHGRYDEAVDAIERLSGPQDGAAAGGGPELRAARELLSATYPGLVAADRRPGAGTDPRVRGAAALSYVLAHGPDAGAVAEAESAMRAMRLGKSTQESLMCTVAALAFADRLEAAASWCDHWLEEAQARHVPLWEAEFASLRAGIALRQGDPARARRLAESALARVPAESWGVCIGGPLANLVQAATDTGDYDSAAGYLDVPVPDGMYASRFGLYFLHARGRYQLATGRPYAALDDFTACGELMRTWGFDQPTLVPWRSEAARAHLALGDSRRAHQLARQEVELAGRGASRARGAALRVLALSGRPAERAALLTEAVQILQACGDRLQTAGALADLGRAHAEAGRLTRARSVLASAGRLAEAVGAKPLARSLRADAHPAGADGPAPARASPAFAALSDAERRVAVLAARGLTNREISEKLTVTVSTVEQHLTRVFRKLGVRARKELLPGAPGDPPERSEQRSGSTGVQEKEW
ncbi:LuxR C-terminal-related transcriptional regulator [Kitasatospora sp. NPDC057223]|uniref:helix-turn-helix transcriptional regulator n=1 Tax=Kitasatospora sp. NPDC057223 TaxID=3346055 RepID=UPI003633DCBF